MAMRYCKDCQLYECCMRTPLGGCQEFDNVRPELNPPITPEDVRKHMSEQADRDWEEFRREAAKDMLASIMVQNGLDFFTQSHYPFIVKAAIALSDELIKQLREEKK